MTSRRLTSALRRFLLTVSVPFITVPTQVASTAGRVTWAQVQSSVAETMCAQVRTSGEDTVVTVLDRSRSECGSAIESPLNSAVDAVLHDAGLVLTPLAIDPPFKAETTNAAEATRHVRAYYLSSQEFLRPFLLRLPTQLAKRNLACEDCPPPPTSPPRHVSWNDFFPYLANHVWAGPASVQPSESSPRYSLHFCAGINGIEGIPSPDHLLVRAGFLSVLESNPLKDQATTLLGQILGEAAFQQLTDEPSRITYLRRRMNEALEQNRIVRDAACQTLKRRSEDLGLIVDGCESPSASRSNNQIKLPAASVTRLAALRQQAARRPLADARVAPAAYPGR